MSDYTPLKKINALIQGPPRTGKSTLVAKLCSMLETKGYNIGGIQTPEIREKNRRVGFWVVDLHTEKKEILAHVEIKSRFRVSKYGVDLNSFNELAITAIKSAIENYDIVVIDEIGKMELFSEKFQDVVIRGLNSSKPVIGTMGKINHPFVRLLKSRSDVNVLTIDRGNMEDTYQEICRLLGLRTI
ncbi:NTPase [Candidatus Borrarchaeum sp.]|uniref:NTPase n=1 Tax=Candidatus Borrarchaeum sp. TaxID=2846742 RepID=UPI00257AE80B|nr:NTPase [Candidatus Borrarchaeum sp.]